MPELIAPTDGAVRTASGGSCRWTARSTPWRRSCTTRSSWRVARTLSRRLAGMATPCIFVAEAVKHAKAVAGLGAGAGLVERAAAGAVALRADKGAVATDQGVLGAPSTTGSLPDGFTEAFCDVLAGHRVWQRPTAAIPGEHQRMRIPTRFPRGITRGSGRDGRDPVRTSTSARGDGDST